MEIKNTRSPNFTPVEEEILLSLVDKYSYIIENKKSNTYIWRKKEEIWETILTEFENKTNTKRSSKTLRNKYEAIKKKTKKELTDGKNIIYTTGSGSGPTIVKVSSIGNVLGGTTAGQYQSKRKKRNIRKNWESLMSDEVKLLENENRRSQEKHEWQRKHDAEKHIWEKEKASLEREEIKKRIQLLDIEIQKQEIL